MDRELQAADIAAAIDALGVGVSVPAGKIEQQWARNFLAFKAWWAVRGSQEIPEKSPHYMWVHKQRQRHRKGRLEPWKLTLLAAIELPMEGPRRTGGPTNLQKAQELVDFFLVHGHYAPTQPTSGRSMVGWRDTMVATDGARGILRLPPGTDEAADLKAANELLRREIPGFDWKFAVKSDLNASVGLTRNAYAPSPGPAWRPKPRMAEVMARAQAALQFPCAAFAACLPEPFGAELERSQQACRVRLYDAGTKPDDVGSGAAAAPLADGYLLLKNGIPFLGALGPRQPLALPRAWEPLGTRYSDNGELRLCFLNSAAGLLVLDYDACLDDDRDRVVPHWLLARTPTGARQVDWRVAARGEFAGKLSSATTTANKAFSANYAELAAFARDYPHETVCWNRNTSQFRVLEHLLRKARGGELPNSHLGRLLQLDFRYGPEGDSYGSLLRAAQPIH